MISAQLSIAFNKLSVQRSATPPEPTEKHRQITGESRHTFLAVLGYHRMGEYSFFVSSAACVCVNESVVMLIAGCSRIREEFHHWQIHPAVKRNILQWPAWAILCRRRNFTTQRTRPRDDGEAHSHCVYGGSVCYFIVILRLNLMHIKMLIISVFVDVLCAPDNFIA